jgi:hypothetical protein
LRKLICLCDTNGPIKSGVSVHVILSESEAFWVTDADSAREVDRGPIIISFLTTRKTLPPSATLLFLYYPEELI